MNLWLLQGSKTLLKISKCSCWFKVDECVFNIPHQQIILPSVNSEDTSRHKDPLQIRLLSGKKKESKKKCKKKKTKEFLREKGEKKSLMNFNSCLGVTLTDRSAWGVLNTWLKTYMSHICKYRHKHIDINQICKGIPETMHNNAEHTVNLKSLTACFFLDIFDWLPFSPSDPPFIYTGG